MLSENIKEKIRNREFYNKKIIELLSEVIDDNPEIRFNQIIYMLNHDIQDIFSEEPDVTYNRLVNKIIESKNKQ